MSGTTLILLLLVVGLPLTMMLMHRAGQGRHMGHGARDRDAPTLSGRAGATNVDLFKSRSNRDIDGERRSGHGCC